MKLSFSFAVLALVSGVSAASAADTPLASPTGDVYEVEFRFRPGIIATDEQDAPDGIAALCPAKLSTGGVGFNVWGDGVWNETSASGVEPSTNEWSDAKLIVREIDGERLIGYLVKSGDDYVRLKTVSGRGWFKVSSEPVVPDLEFEGEGEGELVGSVSEESGEVFAFDVSRPIAGKAISPQLPALFESDDFIIAWRRADWSGEFGEPVSSALEYAVDASDYAHWLKFSVLNGGRSVIDRDVFVSKLPVCYVNTDDGEFPTSAKEKHTGTMRLQGNDSFKEQYNGAVTVNVRGNTSAGYAKKPYKLKLDKKATLCGLGTQKSKHWVLLANMPDMSNMRNKLTFDFANDIGVLGMESTWVDVVFNGRYDGVYQLCEHIRVAGDRVDIFDWEGYSEDTGHTAEDLSWIDASSTDVCGGWIFEFSTEMDEVSRFTVTSGNLKMLTMVNSPEYLNTNGDMFNAARGFLQNYFDACTSPTRKSGEGRHYSAYCDVDSMVGYFLVQELFGNQDAGAKSRYAYKDVGKKLKWGPVWDFDHAAGTSNMQKPSPERWHAAQGSMYCEWLSDYRFARRARSRYLHVRDAYASLAAEGGTIDGYVDYLAESAQANDERWPQSRSFAADVAVLKNFIVGHRAWLDVQFESTTNLLESVRCDSQTSLWDGTVPKDGMAAFLR